MHPFGAGDAHGIILFFLILATLVSSVIVGALTVVAGRSGWRAQLAILATFAISAGVIGAITAAWIANDYGNGIWALMALVALLSFTIAVVVAAAGRAFGPAGIAATVLLVVLLGLISSGGPLGSAFLPDLYRAVAPWLPVGAAHTAIIGALYFEGAGVTYALLVLVAWAILGTAGLAAGSREPARPRTGSANRRPKPPNLQLVARTGRRTGTSGSRESILAAAQTHFAADGYDGATIRAIAATAGVDPALVGHYFGNKEHLFVAAMRFPIDPAEFVPRVLAAGPDEVGEGLARTFFQAWDQPDTAFVALLRSVTTNDQAAEMLRQFISREVIGRLASMLNLDRPQLRAGLAGSQLVGLALVRYVVKIEPIASMDAEELVRAIGPTLQKYLSAEF